MHKVCYLCDGRLLFSGFAIGLLEETGCDGNSRSVLTVKQGGLVCRSTEPSIGRSMCRWIGLRVSGVLGLRLV